MKAKILSTNDTIGIIAPASSVYNQSDIDRGVKTLESWGYRVVLGKHVKGKHGFYAAPDEQRANDLNHMFRQDDIDAVFCVCGGYGTARILDQIDYDAIARNPKILLGFSDITTLHLAIYKKTGLITFHGPHVASFFEERMTPYTKKHLEKALTDKTPIGEIALSDTKKYVHAIGSGVGEGPIVGGNISIICSTLGTPYEIDTNGKVLLLEDLNTEPWIMDHMMAHLRNAGKFDNLAGVVIGECIQCEPRQHQPNYYVDTSLEDIFEDYFAPFNIPVLYGLPLGHTKDMATIPHGVNVSVDANEKSFIVLESGVTS